MSFWGRVGHALGFKNRRSLEMSPPQWGQRWLPVFEAGTVLTVDEAFHVSVVWACMDWHVRSLAPRPWRVYEIDGEVRKLRRDDGLDYAFNTRPNPEMTALAFREALQYSAIGFGNGYAEIVRDGAGRVAELWPLEPDRVIPWRDEVTRELGYRVTQYQGGVLWVPQSRIYHLRGPASFNGGCVSGDNLLVRASRAIAIAASAQQFSASWYRNGGVASGVIEMEAKIPDRKIVDDLRRQFAETQAGPVNAGNVLIMHGGAKWREIQADPNKSQLLETRKFEVEEIARYFGVPLHALGIQAGAHGYGSNIEQLGIMAVRESIRPWAERFEQEADFKLLGGRGPRRETKIDLSELMTGDFQSQVAGVSAAVAGGLLTINEGRERFGWNHIGPDGDVHFLPTTAKPIDQVLEPPAPPAPALPPPLPGRKALPGKGAGTGDGEGSEGASDSAKKAIGIVIAQSLDRYARALKNRRADLAKNAPDKAEANLAQARAQLRARLAEDCSEALTLLGGVVDLAAYASAVEEGEPPRLAADRLVSSLEAA